VRVGVCTDVGTHIDETDLRDLYAHHYQATVRLVSFLLDDVDRCEDVVQEAFARLLATSHVPAPDKLAAYLRSTALNLARDAMRRRRTVRKYAPVVEHEHRRGPTDPAVRVEQEMLLHRLRELPKRQSEVIVLRYWMQLSEDEIATTLGISAGSVKTHASRGLRTLAERFGDEFDESPHQREVV
jgi:RNA polymerase sigma factor (sigma-70 family)